MTKRISAWLGLWVAALFVAVGESHHHSDSYLEFAEIPGCPEIDTASAVSCYVGSRQAQPIENNSPVSLLRKEQTNGDSHKDSNRITAYIPAFCPV